MLRRSGLIVNTRLPSRHSGIGDQGPVRKDQGKGYASQLPAISGQQALLSPENAYMKNQQPDHNDLIRRIPDIRYLQLRIGSSL
jgi:hypothetical protein